MNIPNPYFEGNNPPTRLGAGRGTARDRGNQENDYFRGENWQVGNLVCLMNLRTLAMAIQPPRLEDTRTGFSYLFTFVEISIPTLFMM